MFNRQFTLLAIATLLLSPNLVHANEIDGDRNLVVGDIQILNTRNGTIIQTPNIQVNTLKSSANWGFFDWTPWRTTNPVIWRTREPGVGRTRTSTPWIFNNKVNSDSQTTVTTSTESGSNSTVRSSTIRNSTQNGWQSVNEQQQSIRCRGGGSSVSQSTSTINGRTVSSQVRTNCK